MEHEQYFFNRLESRILLNEVQLRAVKHSAGPLLLLASPGSGKTTTIIARIGYLMLVSGIQPKHILAVSFSKASAQDLLTRFNGLFPELSAPKFSTIHSLAYSIMHSYLKLKQQAFHIIEGDQQQSENTGHSDATGYKHVTKLKLISQIYEELNGERVKEEQLEELVMYISNIKNRLIQKQDWAKLSCRVPKAVEIVERYETVKRHQYECLLIDYDDMLSLALQALEHEPQLLAMYQTKYKYVLTDESQDTSLIQHRIIELLVKPHQQLFVVADDDQAIYSWRGAEVDYLLRFKDHYPQAEVLFLQQNYRSTQTIVNAANFIINQNKSRYAKQMFTENKEGQAITVARFPDAYSEVSFTIAQLLQSEHIDDVAVLYRNHISSILLINELDKREIPFYMKDADDRFYKHWIIQDILNIFRLSFSDKHFHIFEAVATKLQLYINAEQIKHLKTQHQGEAILIWLEQQLKLEPYQKKQLEQLQTVIPNLKDLSPKLAIVQIREIIGYNKAMKQLSERLGFKYDYLMSILDSLELIADGLHTLVEFVDKLKRLEQIQHQAKHLKSTKAVTLSTLHSAKGLEFNTVFLMDLNEGILPSRQDTEHIQTMEEAVRLFYVGITRARNTLYLLSVEQWFGQKVAASRFVKQLNQTQALVKGNEPSVAAAAHTSKKTVQFYEDGIADPTKLAVHTLVEHMQFGQGEIIENNGSKLHIKFHPDEVKVLLISIVLERRILRITS